MNSIQTVGGAGQTPAPLISTPRVENRPANDASAKPSTRGPEAVQVSFSAQALRMAQDASAAENRAPSKAGMAAQNSHLSDAEQREVRQLKQRDSQVRRHEAAHVAAGGQYVRSGARLEYATGPDGKRYATGGEVSIDVSPARTPEATIRKAQVVRRAALAPADPSPQDRRVAAQASRLETQARQELAAERRGEQKDRASLGDSIRPEEDAERPAPPIGLSGAWRPETLVGSE